MIHGMAVCRVEAADLPPGVPVQRIAVSCRAAGLLASRTRARAMANDGGVDQDWDASCSRPRTI